MDLISGTSKSLLIKVNSESQFKKVRDSQKPYESVQIRDSYNFIGIIDPLSFVFSPFYFLFTEEKLYLYPKTSSLSKALVISLDDFLMIEKKEHIHLQTNKLEYYLLKFRSRQSDKEEDTFSFVSFTFNQTFEIIFSK
eukprot:TRINITY_DN4967_c0_g1_i2.p1 TRINITY_DN4967_c0_g1~~TRINITY_DN4967_c0_g1_i2.p1  ORF type:complete len:138 (+),score=33.38 TRINITY_DN4967_c0_g1_i2:333-746(+)